MNTTVQSIWGNTPAGMANAAVSITTGSQAGAQRIYGQGRSSRKKPLNYNPREISAQIMRAVKVRNASVVLTRAKGKVALLQRCKATGQYDDNEVKIAIAHAKRMVKCAQLKVGNLKQEEALAKSRERELDGSRQQKKNEIKRRAAQKENEIRQKAAMEELQQTMKEKEFRRELTRKRRRNRSEEYNKIMEADMKYLQDQTNANQNSYSADAGVTFDISSMALSMHELQMLETQIEMEIEMEMSSMDASMGMDGAAITEGAADTGTGSAAASVGAAVDVSI